MAYKDEYEVARLHARPSSRRSSPTTFEGDFRLRYHLAPAFLPAGKDARGRPLKRSVRPLDAPRSSAASPASAACAAPGPTPSATPPSAARSARSSPGTRPCSTARRRRTAPAPWPEILAAPMEIRGYGPVKEAAIARVRAAVPL